jgi:hypothetical protein
VGVYDYNPAEPWTRQPFDTDLSWACFQLYLAQPIPRRLIDVAKAPSCPVSWAQLQTLCWEDGWIDRARAFDMHLDALRVQTIEQVTREDAAQRAERHGKLARKLQTLGEHELDKWIKVASRPDGMPGLIQVRDVLRLIDRGVRTERLALGESTDKIDTGTELVAGLSIEQLRDLRKIQEAAEQASKG